jgi:ABC-2 type transport system permease protein
MSRLWLVARNTYQREVLKKGFIVALLSVPAVVALTFGLVYVAVELGQDRRPAGYVDHAGILTTPLPAQPGQDDAIAMIPFASEDAAQQALLADDIQAYYVVASDFRQSRRVEVVSKSGSSGESAARFHDFVRLNLLAGEPADITKRIVEGFSVTIRGPAGGREFSTDAGLNEVAPLFIVLFMAMGFMMLMALNPGQPMLAVVEEKENRTMEVMVTSISPGTLIAGKVVGTVAIAGTLVAGWVGLIAAGALLAVRVLRLPGLEGVHVAPSSILGPACLYVPLYVVLAALMTAVGATVVEAREAQQTSFIFIFPLLIPFYVLQLIIEHSDGALAVLLTLFPLSAPTILPLRMYIQPVPAWQAGLSVALLLLSAVGAVWLAGRVFRLGMLRYGQRLGWAEVIGSMKGGRR